MELIEEVKQKIVTLKGSAGGKYLAKALASSCGHGHTVSLNELNGKLDDDNLDLVCRLIAMHREPGWSNQAQLEAMQWLDANGHLSE